MIQATIATHKGTQYYPEHNRRVPDVVSKEKHIDLTRPHECWIDKDVRSAFDEIFGEAIAEYNLKQKRADRKINNYFDKIAADAYSFNDAVLRFSKLILHEDAAGFIESSASEGSLCDPLRFRFFRLI